MRFTRRYFAPSTPGVKQLDFEEATNRIKYYVKQELQRHKQKM